MLGRLQSSDSGESLKVFNQSDVIRLVFGKMTLETIWRILQRLRQRKAEGPLRSGAWA